jgi:hypothetical protein
VPVIANNAINKAITFRLVFCPIIVVKIDPQRPREVRSLLCKHRIFLDYLTAIEAQMFPLYHRISWLWNRAPTAGFENKTTTLSKLPIVILK